MGYSLNGYLRHPGRGLNRLALGGVAHMEGGKSRLARGYSRSATRYDEVGGHMYLAGIRRLLPLVQLPPMPAILDVGCGTALNLIEAAQRFGPTRLLAGIDLSPGMVAVARAKTAALGLPAQIVQGDAERLPYPDGLFDLVICNSVFHWFDDRAGAMREMARTLRPGGKLLLIAATRPGFGEWFALADSILRHAFPDRYRPSIPHLPSGPEIQALMRGAGLEVVHFENPVSRGLVTVPEPFVRFMSVVAPTWSADLSDEEVERLQQIAVQWMRSAWPRGFPVTWSAAEAVGVAHPMAL